MRLCTSDCRAFKHALLAAKLGGLHTTRIFSPRLLSQLEMILQAHEYETAQGMQLQEFFDSTAGKWRTELGRSWAEEIYRRRLAAATAAAATNSTSL